MAPTDREITNDPGFNRFANLLGIEFDEIDEGYCRAHLDIHEDLLHGGGVVQGGVAFTLADTAMARSILPTLHSNEHCTTVEMKISYISAVTEGTMGCEARVIRRGRRIVFAEASVTQGDTLVANATATFAVIGGE